MRYTDRTAAGLVLADALRQRGYGSESIVVGLARGGVVVAAEVATTLGAPLDALAVRKVGHPWHPEFALGAVAPGGVTYLRDTDGLPPETIAAVVAAAHQRATALDRHLHAAHPSLPVAGLRCVLVDDGLATGATMIAAVRWARHTGAAHVVAAAPVGAYESIQLVSRETDEVVCPLVPHPFDAVGRWYASFDQVEDEQVVALLAADGSS